MDRSLDDVIAEKQRSNTRSRRSDYPRDGVKKSSQRDSNRNLDNDWVHDKYDDDNAHRPRNDTRDRSRMIDRYEPAKDGRDEPGKIRVDNLHYDLNESDLKELFTRIGPISQAQILYDRSDRSRGIAYVTYSSIRDAHRAIREFDGENAFGQPIKLTLQPGPRSGRNPFDGVKTPGRSLFERIGGDTVRERRSESPPRRSNTRRAAPDGIDRYVPGQQQRLTRSRSPISRRGAPRRPGARRDDSDRARGGRNGRSTTQRRPKKTAGELDAEMDDYWGPKEDTTAAPAAVPAAAVESNGLGNTANTVAAPAPAPVPVAQDDDIDMIL